jgi:adenosine 3'-phospho 5'-phosphosulfate transporter B2
MLVRFYLEEETSSEHHHHRGYAPVPLDEENDVELVSSKSGITESKGETEDDVTSSLPSKEQIKRDGSFLNVNEWAGTEGTKMEVIQRVIFCAFGLNVCFCIWGLLQERLLTFPYGGEFFVYSYGLVFLARLGGLIMSGYLMYHYKVAWVSTPLYEFAYPSVANMMSSWCQYEALKFVSFPTQMLAKAFKMLPVMLMGKIMHNKKYEGYEYVSAGTIGFGIYLFLDSSEHITLGYDVFGNPEGVRGVWCGIMLLILFLFFDSFTAQWQTRMFELHKEMSPLQMMVLMNAFSVVFSGVTLVHQEEFTPALSFVYRHPTMIIHLVIFVVCATLGQMYIFYTVKNFGAIVFSVIMSMRILFSILLSCFVYNHPITELGVVGMVVVFGSITYRIKRKTEGQPLIRWKGGDNQKSMNILHEWHEHLDI